MLDFLIDKTGLEKQLKYANQAVEERYDTGKYTPQLNRQRELASEGIPDEQIRQKILQRLYADDFDTSIFGGNQAVAIAGSQKQSDQKMKTLAESELDISLKDAQVKSEAKSNVANIMSEIQKVRDERQAKIKENRMMMEAEASRRKSGLLGMGIGAVGAYLGTSSGSEALTSGMGWLTDRASSMFGNNMGSNDILSEASNFTSNEDVNISPYAEYFNSL